MSKQWLVTWEIDVEAETPEDAAQQARAAQVRPGTLATVFLVGNGEDDRLWKVDLLEDTVEEIEFKKPLFMEATG